MTSTTPPGRVSISLHKTDGADAKIAMLVQRGFLHPINGPISIENLLLGLPGFSPAYIRDRVQTIFVNGLAEDDTDRILIPGNTLALSAAMPGLAGAIFRRGGRHGSLRTRPAAPAPQQSGQEGFITIKLFNMIGTETGPLILKQGILIRGSILARFLERQGERVLPLIREVRINGQTIPAPQLGSSVASMEQVFLRIGR